MLKLFNDFFLMSFIALSCEHFDRFKELIGKYQISVLRVSENVKAF